MRSTPRRTARGWRRASRGSAAWRCRCRRGATDRATMPAEKPMNATDLAYTPATELVPRIRSKALSPVEVTRAVLERIEQVNPAINAFCTVTAAAALAAARAAEAAVMKGERLGPDRKSVV